MDEPWEPDEVSLLDTCSVLSLYATRRMTEIIPVLPGPAAIVDVVGIEALYVRRLVDGDWAREPVDLAPFVSAGARTVIAAESEDELQTFVDLAADLDDGEAMSGALAIHRRFTLVTDDKKAERVLAGRVRLRSTLDVVKTWTDASRIDAHALRTLLTLIDERGYRPPNNHPLKPWWDRSI